ncbi:MAG: lysylphosphatidylglycerol synthetase family protein [Phycisphaeraceae bacterium]|nr:MAG: lysylphosphatidylglycerol synthetase family protein [Phycisphaeraceae bacterium]
MAGPNEPRGTTEPQTGPDFAERLAASWRWAKLALQVGLPALVVWLAWREIHALDLHKIRDTIDTADATLVALGIAVAFFALAVMGLYDAVAFPKGRSGTLSFPRRWLLGATLFGWTNFVSMGPVGGPAIRLLAYRRFGLSGPEITRGLVAHYIASAAGLTAWLLAAWLPIGISSSALVIRLAIALIGSVVFAVVAARAAVPILKRHRYGAELDRLPMAPLGLVSFLDWGLTLLAFELIVRSVGVTLEPSGAARTVLTGQFAGLMSMIPGGLGSADAVWFKGFDLLGVGHNEAAAAIVAFRAGFFLLPWAGSLIVIYIALATQSERLRLWQRRVVAGAVAVNAILLLLSAATPAVGDRLHAVARLVPLSAIEASHLLAAVSALLMLLLVRGLLRGYRSAFVLTVTMLLASAIAHPLKGGDVEEAVASVVLLGLLVGVRGAFTRRGRVPIGWQLLFAAGLGALALYLISGFAAFEKIPYHQDLWITFAEKAEASRFLRGGVLLGAVVLVAAVRQATRPVSLWVKPGAEDVDRAVPFIRAHAEWADPLLVGARDKGVWFFEPRAGGPPAGLVLYQRQGDKLIVLKDPVLAPDAEPPAVIEAFLRFADDLDVDVVFSMISADWMSHLHEFGFHFLKINEEAIVPLDGFSLEGGKNAGFRRNQRDMEKAGVIDEFIEPPLDDALVDQLREVSDAWLASKGGHELQFSACCFSPWYVRANPVGLARDAGGRIVAFVNVLATRPGGPAMLDFMRYTPEAPPNVMDFVIIRTMQTLAERGYASFSLGAAPLSDVGVFKGSRMAERLLHLFSLKAERIYNYRGLLHYKSKFHPEWEPRYLAYQQPWDWASALIAVTRLVGARGRDDRRRIAAARMGIEPSPEAGPTGGA